MKQNTPTLGPCSCKRGQQRDNCPQCEGTGQRIDFAAIRARNRRPAEKRLTMLEMGEADIETAQRIAERLGFTQHAYTSTSDVIGLFCLPDHAQHRHGCVVKTKEFGFMFVADLEDMQLHDIHEEQNAVNA